MLTQVTANRFMDFDILAKHSPVKAEKYSAMLSTVIEKTLRTGFKFEKKKKIISYLVYL